VIELNCNYIEFFHIITLQSSSSPSRSDVYLLKSEVLSFSLLLFRLLLLLYIFCSVVKDEEVKIDCNEIAMKRKRRESFSFF
jgi:hypothetical protein